MYLNGSEEWEVVAFNLTKQLNKLVVSEDDLILTPVSEEVPMRGNKKTERLTISLDDNNLASENMSAKKWWKFWE